MHSQQRSECEHVNQSKYLKVTKSLNMSVCLNLGKCLKVSEGHQKNVKQMSETYSIRIQSESDPMSESEQIPNNHLVSRF